MSRDKEHSCPKSQWFCSLTSTDSHWNARVMPVSASRLVFVRRVKVVAIVEPEDACPQGLVAAFACMTCDGEPMSR